MLLLTNQMQEVQVFFVLVQYVINQLFLIPAHYIIILGMVAFMVAVCRYVHCTRFPRQDNS